MRLERFLKFLFEFFVGSRAASVVGQHNHPRGELAIATSLLAVITSLASICLFHDHLSQNVFWVAIASMLVFLAVIPIYRYWVPEWPPAAEIANNLIPASLCLSCGYSALALGGSLPLSGIYASAIPLLSVMICRRPLAIAWSLLMVFVLALSFLITPLEVFEAPRWITLAGGIVVVIPTLISMLIHRDIWEQAHKNEAVARRRLRTQHEEQRLLDKRLSAFERQESLDLMAGRVAHDLNNLLTAVLTSAEIAKLSAETGDNREVLACVDTIELAATSAGKLSRQLLEYTGKNHQTIAAINLSERMPTTITLGQAASPARTQIYLQNIGDVWVEGDPTQLDQVIVNLIRNAAQSYEPATGKVDVKLDQLEVTEPISCTAARTALAPGEYARICVRDYGRGIPSNDFERIFEPFYTDRMQGKGLGLAAVGGIVAAHGGGVTVRSDESGTEFTLLLPAATAPDDSVGHDAPKASVPDTRTCEWIVVADDEPSVRYVVQRLLERMGHKTIVTSNGSEAIKVVAADARISMAVLDVSMPVMDGYEALSQIRALSPKLPVLLMSGYATTIPQHHEKDEYTEYITKPFSAADFKNRMRELGLRRKVTSGFS